MSSFEECSQNTIKQPVMQPPPSYQIPKHRASPKSSPQVISNHPRKRPCLSKRHATTEPISKTTTEPPRLEIHLEQDRTQLPANDVLATTTSEATNQPILHRTRRRTQTHNLSPLVEEWNKSIQSLRTHHLDTTKSKLSTLSSTHKTTLAALSTWATDETTDLASRAEGILSCDLPGTQLSFINSKGVLKGTTTLAERMDLFAARIAQTRGAAEKLLAERKGLDVEIEGLVGRLKGFVDGDADPDGDRSEMLRAEIGDVVTKTCERWKAVEDAFRRKLASNGKSLARIYQGQNGCGGEDERVVNNERIDGDDRDDDEGGNEDVEESEED